MPVFIPHAVAFMLDAVLPAPIEFPTI